DFVVSDQLISLTLSQIAGNKVLGTVFNRLFESEGAEIYLKPAVNYINTDQAVNFFTIAESALRRNETAIGYRIDSQRTTPNCTHNNKDMNYGLVLNPDKTIAVSFSTEDKIIVLAETGNS
ncbi:MAG: potassium transporter TrkA, partial [Pseudomonadota bacterium]|nr:potassium transporter TrkA [Pseudomonadota bacterium]